MAEQSIKYAGLSHRLTRVGAAPRSEPPWLHLLGLCAGSAKQPCAPSRERRCSSSTIDDRTTHELGIAPSHSDDRLFEHNFRFSILHHLHFQRVCLHSQPRSPHNQEIPPTLAGAFPKISLTRHSAPSDSPAGRTASTASRYLALAHAISSMSCVAAPSLFV